MPVILSHTPAGTSLKTLIHFGQVRKYDRFQQYDYGKKENLKSYNTVTPPEFDMRTVNVPTAILYAQNDWVTNPVVKEIYFIKS